MSDQRALTQLCRRLLDIDPTCNQEKGCPFHYAAEPMIVTFRDQLYPPPGIADAAVFRAYLETMPETLRRLINVDGQGRVCEIDEVQFHAREFLAGNTQ